MELAELALRLRGGQDAAAMDTLAAAYAEVGQFEDAVRVVDSAIQLARIGGPANLLRQLEQRRTAYVAGNPARIAP